MNRLPTALAAALLLTTLAAAGCGSGGAKVPDDAGFGRAGAYEHDVADFDGPAEVTAETYFAAGRFHESASISPARGRRQTPAQAAKHLEAQRKLAVKQYRRALDLDAGHKPSLFRLAALLTALGEYDDAGAAWERYVEATGGSAGAWVNLAICREVARDVPGAEAAYRHAVAADPRHEAARVNLGMLLARNGDLQAAAGELSMVLDPASVHWHLGHALQEGDRPEAAARHFRAAASLDPKYAPQDPDAPAIVQTDAATVE